MYVDPLPTFFTLTYVDKKCGTYPVRTKVGLADYHLVTYTVDPAVLLRHFDERNCV